MHPLPPLYIHIEYIFCIINCIYYESEEFAAHNYRNYFNKPPESVENTPLHPFRLCVLSLCVVVVAVVAFFVANICTANFINCIKCSTEREGEGAGGYLQGM